MTTMIYSIMFFTIYSILSTKSPMSLMMKLIVLKILIFTKMFMESGNSWFPLIMMMIMIGGIMIMMMVMVSLEPNHKNSSTKMMMNTMLMIFIVEKMNMESTTLNTNMSMKLMMESLENMTFLILLMGFYFICFTMIVSSEKTPLRVWKCLKSSIL